MSLKLRAISIAQQDLDALVGGQDCSLTMEQLEQSLESMEQRIDDRINKNMQSVHQRVEEISAARASIAAGHADTTKEQRCGTGSAEYETRLARVEDRIESIAEAIGVTFETKVGDNDADRKRLKERLKEALKFENSDRSLHKTEKESWMEYIFGICRHDGRAGKVGSRYVHA